MNNKKILTILILSVFLIGMCIGAADAAHTVKKGYVLIKIFNKYLPVSKMYVKLI